MPQTTLPGENLLDYVHDWERRYQCPTPTAALGHDLQLPEDRLALLLARLEGQGRIRRVRGSLGALDVALCPNVPAPSPAWDRPLCR